MRTWIFLLSALLVGTASTAGHGQTLNERLIAEDAAQLVRDAREKGNIVRGAILFHQGNLNCVKCHRSTAERDRIGPVLTRLGEETSDESIVESILQPSKVIKKGFEPVIAATLDGQVITGMVVTDTDQKLVIRDSQQVDQLITIPRDDLDGVRVGTVSTMPAELANQLQDRQQFLDLLRYVIDLKEQGPAAESAGQAVATRRELSPALEGLILVQRRNCLSCHTAADWDPPIAAKQAPRLKWSSKWLDPAHLNSFIADPHGVKPGTTMPEILGHLDADTRAATARELTHYLASVADNEFSHQPVDPSAITRGRELFHAVGCVACHAPRDEQALEQPLAESLPLGDLSGKYSVPGLVGFLENPLAARPSGWMPHVPLTHQEAIDIANFLLQASQPRSADWEIDTELAAAGKAKFLQFNCARCHTELTPGSVGGSAAPALTELKPDQGCLSGDTGPWPNHHLSVEEREQIAAALEQFAPKLDFDAATQTEVTLRAFRCTACHQRDDLGGVSQDRNPHFQTINLNLGDQGRIPPTLTGVGAKLKRDWMRDVLVNARNIRPYMKTRMPQYGEPNIGHLVDLFQSQDQLPPTEMVELPDPKQARELGLELAGNQGLNCAACHTYKYQPTDTMPAVDLTEMAERLKKDWFYRYMLDPQRYSPNTVMPSFWPGGKSIRPSLEGQPREQLEALWQYLSDGRQARAPRGVVREKLEIVVTDEAQMLRRKYPGIGKRGIGVGYPGSVNLAFDAEQLRLASVWKGGFVDPGGVWTGQGSGNVRPLGQTVDFPAGPDLDRAESPWIVDDGRPPHHRFRGYTLDPQRRPTFRYQVGDVQVEDKFQEIDSGDGSSDGAVGLQRTIRITAGESGTSLRLRVGQAKAIVRGDAQGTYRIGDRLTVRLDVDPPPKPRSDSATTSLEIPIELNAGQQRQLQIEYRWD